MKALWLVSWYPDKLSPFNGDFIKRHAEAVSLFEEVQVIYVVKDEKGIITKKVSRQESVNGKLSETIIHYYIHNSIPFLNKFLSAARYRKLYKEAVASYIQKNGEPDIVHVHVGMKAGIIARWIYRKWKIPYVISEHWTGFLTEARERFDQLPFYFRNLWLRVMQGAKACSTVSDYLKQSIQKNFTKAPVTVIPNVVNTSVFNPSQPTDSLKFIHISNLDDFKNPQDILRAFAIVTDAYPDAKLEIIGSKRADIVQMANDLQLKGNVSFLEEMPQSELANYIRQSNALILYSKYETFGCVIIEANACGIPVLVSDIPVFHETVNSGNGIFASPANPASLAEKMISMINNRPAFDSNKIAMNAASKYSYQVVGKQFSEWYREVLRGN